MPSAEYRIRSFQAGDEPQILDLFARCFPHATRTIEHFRWKYQLNPIGNERISLAFDDAGRLVGHYAGYPVRLAGGTLAYHIGDTMTDPAVRHVGRGPTSILGRTARHFYDTFCEGQVAFNFGFNVANIQKFSTRFLRAERVEPVAYRLWPQPAPMARWQRWVRGAQVEIVREVTPEYDALFERAVPMYEFLVRRDARYLRWRYLQCPDVSYLFVALRRWRKLRGWSVFRLRDGRLHWIDGLFDPRHLQAIPILLRQVADAREIDCWCPPRPARLHDMLVSLGFQSSPQPEGLGVMCVPFTMPDAGERIRQALYYTMGDSDLF